ncbi:hypothetical protein KIN20_034071 [Parelaphostrongylus tenuis]|uniref:Uncharacterized protein n=1 Tax=Parelaphostrongylus tenuis TaxID=148309 RepID=A0AAD5R9L4_PARTN|nr:hypothetical protein KIN20_034071 [Parelaphostrongylus tenuis]
MGNESYAMEAYIKDIVEIVTSPYYRYTEIFHAVVSAPAVLLIIWVLMKYWKRLIFHYNIKILLFSIYAACFLHAFLMTICQCYQLYIGYSYKEPCEVFLHPIFYIVTHLSLIFSFLWMENILMVMVLERSIAIFYADHHYGEVKKKMGIFWLFLTVLITACQFLWAYVNAEFDKPRFTFMQIPSKSDAQMKALTIFLLVTHVVGSTMMVFVYIANYRHRKRMTHSLNIRFQVYETQMSSHLLFTLSTMQIIIYFAYLMASVYLENMANLLTTSRPIVVSILVGSYVISVYPLLLPLVTMLFLTRAKRVRQSNILSMTQMKASGAEGWATYSNQLKKQWN